MDAPSDLIVDVARAADPERAAAMAQRLSALSSGSVDPAMFTAALSSAGSSPTATSPPARAVVRSQLQDPALAEDLRITKARQQFEASLLTTFVNEMMPKDTASAYGGGYAGDMWRSVLSEKIADQIAKSGALGIASRVFDNGHSPALAKLQRASSHDEARSGASVTSANALSLPSGAAAADGGYLFAHEKTS